MNVLFEDDGQLKAGTLLADHDASLQVEAVSGKRQKIKAAHVLLRFAAPSPGETIARAQELTPSRAPAQRSPTTTRSSACSRAAT
jgi:exoribonuclease-2